MRARLLTAGYESLLRPFLFRAHGGDPEAIHETTIHLLERVGRTRARNLIQHLVGVPKDPVTVAGVRFRGRVGVAAGLDKDGIAGPIWANLGFGFAELGTVTAQPQPGNPTPRLYRLQRSQALINRMGFNNLGAQALADRLDNLGVKRGQNTLGIPLGISIGKTKTVPLEKAIDDYLISLEALHRNADYIAVNISSPNTEGLRSLQAGVLAYDLVKALVDKASALDATNPQPIFVKVAPDLSQTQLDDLLEAVVRAGASGLIATNTTMSRDRVVGVDAKYLRQPGGLSGRPLTQLSRRIVARVVQSSLPVIASGGIMTPSDAKALFDLGAKAVQVFTGFIYSGPGLVAGINALPSQKEIR